MPNWRHGTHRAAAAALAFALIGATASPAMVFSIGQVPGAVCDGGWTVTYPPALVGATAVDVTYHRGRPWVAGSAVFEARRPTAFTAVGSTQNWDPVPVPPTSNTSVLTAIAPGGANRLWTAGEDVGPTTQPLILQWDGTRWARDALPILPNGGALSDIAQVPNGPALAVGHAADLNGQHPLALRWVNGAWRAASPVVQDNASLTGLSSASDGTTWAVGWVDTVAGHRPLLERWTASGWQRDTVVTGPAVLVGVVVNSATDAWAVGYHEGAALSARVIHWDGSTWTEQPGLSVTGVTGSMLRDITMVGGVPVAVGTAWEGPSGNSFPLIAELRGGSWQVTLRAGGITDGELLGVASGTQLVAVGRMGDRAVALTPCVNAQSPSPVRAAGASQAGPRAVTGAQASVTGSPGEASGVSNQAGSGPPGPSAQAATGLEIRDMTDAAGLRQTTLTYSGNAVDFNADGWPDLVIGRHSRPLWVLQNTGKGTFIEPVPNGYRRADRHGCAVGDLNGDGRPDIACVVGANLGLSVKENEVWLDPFNPAATNQAAHLGVADQFGRGRRTVIFDANHDGRLDLYVANDPSRADGLPSDNRLFLNTGDGFGTGRDAGLDRGMGGICLVPADLDGDGWTDLVVCSYVQIAGFAGLRIFHNEAGRFVDVTGGMGIAGSGDVDAKVADMNGDGTADLVRVSSARLEVDLQRGGRFVQAYYLPASAARTVTLADVNGDGALDIYLQRGTRDGPSQDMLLLNDGSGRNFTSVALPRTLSGSGGGAIVIDYDRNGRQDLVILHGDHIEPGPIQLLAFGPPWPFDASQPSPSASMGVEPSPSLPTGTGGPPSPLASGAVVGTPGLPTQPSTSGSGTTPPPSLPPSGSSGSVDERRTTAVVSGAATMLISGALLALLLPALRRRRQGRLGGNRGGIRRGRAAMPPDDRDDTEGD